MSITPTNRSEGVEAQSIPVTNTSILQQIRPPEALMTDSSIISLTSVAAGAIYHDRKDYVGEAGQPKLPAPTEGKSPVPVEPAVQNIVSGFISKEITMLLADVSSPGDRTDLFNSLTQGLPLQNPALSAKAVQTKNALEQKVRQKTGLENFTLNALYEPVKEAWIATPVKPYTNEQKKEIENFYESARKTVFEDISQLDPDLGIGIEVSLLKTALEGGKIDPKIKSALAGIDNAAIEIAREEYGLPIGWKPGTIETDKWKPINKGIINPRSVGEARAELLRTNTDEVSVSYIAVIVDALFSQKEVLTEELIINSNLALENMDAKKVNQESRDVLAAEQAEKVLRSNKISDVLGVFSKTMMVVGAALSIFAMASTILTAGLLSPLAVAAMAVTGAMLAYSVVDATTGVTSKVFEKVNEIFDDMTSGLPDALASAIKLAAVLTAVAAIAILVVATAPAGGTAVSGVARQALTKAMAKTIVSQGMRMATRQIAVQVALILLMGSGVLMEFPSEMLKLTDLSDKAQRALMMVIFIAEMVAVMGIAAKSTTKIIESGNATATASAADEVIETAENTAKSSKLKFLDDFRTKIIEKFHLDNDEVINVLTHKINRFVQVTNVSVQTLTKAVEMGFQSALFHNYRALAEMEQAEAELVAMTDVLDKTLEQLSSLSSGASEMSADFGKSIASLLNSVSRQTANATNTYQA